MTVTESNFPILLKCEIVITVVYSINHLKNLGRQTDESSELFYRTTVDCFASDLPLFIIINAKQQKQINPAEA